MSTIDNDNGNDPEHNTEREAGANEKREDPRLNRQERAFIRVMFDDGAALSTQTEDISRGGFRAHLSGPVPVGSILHAVIALEPSQLRFLLAVEVRWCQPQRDGFVAGFALLDARDTDYDAWRTYADSHSE